MKKTHKTAVASAQSLVQFLREASSLPQSSIRDTNPFKFLGFDRSSGRLGWARKAEYGKIEEEAGKFLKIAQYQQKKKYLFLGMGGSINGIKVAQRVFNLTNVLAWDSLDFSLFHEQEAFFKNPKEITVIGITKSGTTDETHLLVKTFAHFLGKDPAKEIVWILDDSSLSKLYHLLNQTDIKTCSLQIDKNDDIGGRFSSPTTFVFLAPLFLSLPHDRVKQCWEDFLASHDQIMLDAAQAALLSKEKPNGYFAIKLPASFVQPLETWITQLFQESIGSKKEGFLAKTLVLDSAGNAAIPADFTLLDVSRYADAPDHIFALLFYLQCFVAFFSILKDINFVNQDYVEEYKRVLKELKKTDECAAAETLSLQALEARISKKIQGNPAVRFIEVVYFGHLSVQQIEQLKQQLQRQFPGQTVFVFLGSDWNHHSYQAAFKAQDTFFVVLTAEEYALPAGQFAGEDVKKCVTLLRQISCATYKTLAGRAEYAQLQSKKEQGGRKK